MSQLAAFLEALASCPDAYVSAVTEHGKLIRVPVEVPLPAGARTTGGPAVLDGVHPDDLEKVIAMFQEALERGSGSTTIRLGVHGGLLVELSLYDARDELGVLLALSVPREADATAAVPVPQPRQLTGRLARIRKDSLSALLDVDDTFCEMLGWQRDEVVGRRTLELTHPDDRALAIASWVQLLEHPGVSRRVRMRFLRKDGGWVWFETTNINRLDHADGAVLGEMVNVQAEMDAYERIRAREQLLSRLAESLPHGVLEIDREGAVQYANDRLHELLGCPRDAVQAADLFAAVAAEDAERLTATLHDVLVDGRDADVRLRITAENAVDRLCHLSFRVLHDSDQQVTGAVVSVTDVTESARLEGELQHRADHDPLTGCRNRSSIMELLGTAVQQGEAGTAVVYVDLDQFKAVNDTHGHGAGDALLIATAERLRSAARTGEVGRLGGDEFLVVCPGIRSAQGARGLARRIAAALNEDVEVGDLRLPTRASLGTAWAPAGTTDPDTLVAQADADMYQAKRSRPRLLRSA